MLESRLSRNFNIKERLSVQHILSCSVYNQGCDGGYSYLSLKFGNEVELEKYEMPFELTISENAATPSDCDPER
jgi:hypothetical protein